MTKKQMIIFLEKIGENHFKLFFYNRKTHWAHDFGGYARTTGIYLNSRYMKGRDKKSILYVKSMLLHEVGHLRVKWHKLFHVKEYRAQMWAIQKARDIGDKKLEATLIHDIDERWLELFPHPRNRYNKASKLYHRKKGK